MGIRRKRKRPRAVAVILDKREWDRFIKTAAELEECVHAGRDLVFQLNELLAVKRRQKRASPNGAETKPTDQGQ